MQCHDADFYGELLFRRYKARGDYVRAKMFDVGDDKNLMDIHKVLSCMMWEMVDVSLITFDASKREKRWECAYPSAIGKVRGGIWRGGLYVAP